MDELIQPDRLPPHSKVAEQAVLGSMLRDPDCVPGVSEIIHGGDFYFAAHLFIFDLVLKLRSGSKPVDLVSVGEEIASLGKFEEIGGPAYLALLWDAAPTAANADYYARIIRDYSVRRALIHHATEIMRDAYERNGEADELAISAARRISTAGDRFSSPSVVTLDEALRDALHAIDLRITRQVAETDLPTGLVDLDMLTAGLHPQELVTLAARPGVGKSALALKIAISIARAKRPVLFVSLEMGRVEQTQRLLISESGVPNERIRRGRITDAEAGRVATAYQVLRDHPFWIDDAPHQTVIRIAATARKLHRQHPLGLVAIDYLQLIRAANPRLMRHEQVAEQTRELKLLAKDLGVPVLLLAQLNRRTEDEHRRPRLADIRESGAVEQDSDTVMLLHAPEAPSEEGVTTIELIVAKQRNGPTGLINLAYRGAYFRFENHSV